MSNRFGSYGSVLVVDDDVMFRDGVAARLRDAGWAALVAPDYEEGLKRFAENQDVRVVILDHPTIGCDASAIVKALKRCRPEATIIGNSGADRRSEFAAAGVDDYLQKPWRIADLMSVLRLPLGACVECGLPLPLRMAGPDETAQHWVCASCGARYQGIYVAALAGEVGRYVVRADQLDA